MVSVKASVDIQADPAAVFDLMTDVPRKAKLDRSVHVIGIARETPGPIREGTVFHYRLVIEDKMADYRNTVIAFEPGRLMVTRSDSNPHFEISIVVEPIEGGARVTQEERFTLTAMAMPIPTAQGIFGGFMRLLFGGAEKIEQDAEDLAAEEEEMATKLQPRLEAWLQSIKKHLETQTGYLEA
ncbi:MAG: SRPBCC family protein [Pseudomonadota bacterium]|nr:MAG: SRPBCC family protein [Pseudomonadota bacterium]